MKDLTGVVLPNGSKDPALTLTRFMLYHYHMYKAKRLDPYLDSKLSRILSSLSFTPDKVRLTHSDWMWILEATAVAVSSRLPAYTSRQNQPYWYERARRHMVLACANSLVSVPASVLAQAVRRYDPVDAFKYKRILGRYQFLTPSDLYSYECPQWRCFNSKSRRPLK